MLVTFLLPVTGLLLGWAVLGEAVPGRAWPGMALIGAGLFAIDGGMLRAARHNRPGAPALAAQLSGDVGWHDQR